MWGVFGVGMEIDESIMLKSGPLYAKAALWASSIHWVDTPDYARTFRVAHRRQRLKYSGLYEVDTVTIPVSAQV